MPCTSLEAGLQEGKDLSLGPALLANRRVTLDKSFNLTGPPLPYLLNGPDILCLVKALCQPKSFRKVKSEGIRALCICLGQVSRGISSPGPTFMFISWLGDKLPSHLPGPVVMSPDAPASAHCLLRWLTIPTVLLASGDFSFFLETSAVHQKSCYGSSCTFDASWGKSLYQLRWPCHQSCKSCVFIMCRFKSFWWGDFPGGAVDKTPRSQCREPGFNPWTGN